MSVAPLKDPKAFNRAMGQIDAERRKKTEQMKQSGAQSLSLGAGLLLQYAVKCFQSEESEQMSGDRLDGEWSTEVSAEAILQENSAPIEFAYQYGAHGKPYLDNVPGLFFSLSHSGDYVLCAVSDREIGADIQQERKEQGERIAGKYFTESEREWYLSAETETDRKSRFYRLWAAKEAYMKLTGLGLAQGLQNFTADIAGGVIIDQACPERKIRLLEVQAPKGYAAAVSIAE